MSLQLVFSDQGWDDLTYWITTDKKIAKRLIRLINECQRSPFEGIGKPEALRGNLSSYWSRRLNDEHRLVYCVKDNELWIVQARLHYR